MGRWRVALLLALVLALAIHAPWALQGVYALAYRASVGRLPPLPPPGAGERLLVLSPHPDDESLCCGGLIREALAQGAEVFVAWLTSGDGFEGDAALLDRTLRPGHGDYQALALRRMGEAQRAAQVLGLPPDHLFFLCYPDRGLLHFLERRAIPYTSPYTGLGAVTYPGCFSPGAPYTGEALEKDLEGVLERVRPTLLLAPSPLDAHPDHRATAYLALRALRPGVRALFWIVHGGWEWPLPKGYHPGLPLEPPPRGRGLSWRRLDLPPSAEEAKRQALLAHQSQQHLLSRFLMAFIRRNELYSPLPRHPLPESGR